MSVVPELLQSNAKFAAAFHQGDLPIPPRRQLAVVTCMDARMDVHSLLGLRLGDAHVIRNAGGVVTEDVIRSLVISQRLLKTKEIVLIHHTNCGLQMLQEDSFKSEIERDSGQRPTFRFEAFQDLAANVRESMQRVRATPFVPHRDSVHGFIYDVQTGKLAEVR